MSFETIERTRKEIAKVTDTHQHLYSNTLFGGIEDAKEFLLEAWGKDQIIEVSVRGRMAIVKIAGSENPDQIMKVFLLD